jgi:hypothetical protein
VLAFDDEPEELAADMYALTTDGDLLETVVD